MLLTCGVSLMLAAVLEIETGTSYHCAVRPATNLTARIEVDGDTLVQWKGTMEFRDYFGHRFFVPVEGWGAKGRPIRIDAPATVGRLTVRDSEVINHLKEPLSFFEIRGKIGKLASENNTFIAAPGEVRDVK